MQLSTNLTGVFVLYITLPNVQNEDPFKIILKSLPKGSHMILDRSRNKEHRDLQLSTNLTGVFVLYITLPNVQNEDPFKIILKSLPKDSHMILDRSRNKERRDLQLSTNLTGVFVLYITLPNVQNEDPFKIVLKAKTLTFADVLLMLLMFFFFFWGGGGGCPNHGAFLYKEAKLFFPSGNFCGVGFTEFFQGFAE